MNICTCRRCELQFSCRIILDDLRKGRGIHTVTVTVMLICNDMSFVFISYRTRRSQSICCRFSSAVFVQKSFEHW